MVGPCRRRGQGQPRSLLPGARTALSRACKSARPRRIWPAPATATPVNTGGSWRRAAKDPASMPTGRAATRPTEGRSRGRRVVVATGCANQTARRRRLQAPPTMAVTTPAPRQSGQVAVPSLPLPPQRRQTDSPVPGVPAGASSPGFTPGWTGAAREPSPEAERRSGLGMASVGSAEAGRATCVPKGPARCPQTGFDRPLDNRLRNATLPSVTGGVLACRNILTRQRLRGSAAAWESPRKGVVEWVSN